MTVCISFQDRKLLTSIRFEINFQRICEQGEERSIKQITNNDKKYMRERDKY